jgi:serine O-acetyltransferase
MEMLQRVKAIPHLILFKRSPSKLILEKDIHRWIQECEQRDPSREETHSFWENLAWLLELENTVEFRNLFYYRIGNPSKVWDKILLKLATTLYKPLSSLQIMTPQIGPGLLIKHGYGSVIDAAQIGKNCLIFHEVMIGFKDRERKGKPIIGDYVHIALGAKIIGAVTIGDNVDIGANAVVVTDIPSNSVVTGAPASVIKHLNNREEA